jgi:hypothetical protein
MVTKLGVVGFWRTFLKIYSANSKERNRKEFLSFYVDAEYEDMRRRGTKSRKKSTHNVQ